MISVIYKKSDYLKTLKYVLGKDDAEIVNTNMGVLEPSLLNKQFLAVASLNKSVKRRCTHIVISNTAQENISNIQYHQITKKFLQDLGYLPTQELSISTSQFVSVRHHDRDHEHIHIVTSRIQHNGKSVNDSFDYFNAEVSIAKISAQLGLKVTPVSNQAIASRLKQEFEINVEVSPEHQKSIKLIHNPHKTPTSKQIIRKAIAEAVIGSPNVSTFIKRLEKHSVTILPKIQGDNLLGLTYIHKDVKIAGYQVYKPYSWAKLQSEYGLTYDYQKDKEVLKAAKLKAVEAISSFSKNFTPSLETELTSKKYQKIKLSVQPTIHVEVNHEAKKDVEVEHIQLPIVGVQNSIPGTSAKSHDEQPLLTTEPSSIQALEQALITPIPVEANVHDSQELPFIITKYMKMVNKNFIEGKQLRVELNKNLLEIHRIVDNTSVMQTNYANGKWNEQLNVLTTNEIKQIKHLQLLTQQKLINKQKTKNNLSKVQKDMEVS